MRTTAVVLCACLVAAPAVAAAQSKPAAAASMSSGIRANWDSAKKWIKDSAEQMPEANYSFKPVDTVRTFGQILAHVAGASYVFCAAAKGEKSPFAEDHFEKAATTRAAIIKAVDGAIAYCDGAYGALTDASGAQTITMPFDMGTAPRAQALVLNIGHLAEHYGNLVTYFRIKGMVPPSSK